MTIVLIIFFEHWFFRNFQEWRELLRLPYSSNTVKKKTLLHGDWTGLLSFVSAVLLSTFILLFLPSSSVSLSNFYLAVPIRGCLGKHSCMSSPFPIAILNGTCSLRALILFCGDVPAIKAKLNKHTLIGKVTVRTSRRTIGVWLGRVERLYGCTYSSADTSNFYVAKYRLVSVLLQYLLYLFCIIACLVILWSKFTFEIIMAGPMGP